jgi:hypothetical protein
MSTLYRILYSREKVGGTYPGDPNREVEYAEVREKTTDTTVLAAYDWPRAMVQERADILVPMFNRNQRGQHR